MKLVTKQLQIDPHDSQDPDILLNSTFAITEISLRKSLHYVEKSYDNESTF